MLVPFVDAVKEIMVLFALVPPKAGWVACVVTAKVVFEVIKNEAGPNQKSSACHQVTPL